MADSEQRAERTEQQLQASQAEARALAGEKADLHAQLEQCRADAARVIADLEGQVSLPSQPLSMLRACSYGRAEHMMRCLMQ